MNHVKDENGFLHAQSYNIVQFASITAFSVYSSTMPIFPQGVDNLLTILCKGYIVNTVQRVNNKTEKLCMTGQYTSTGIDVIIWPDDSIDPCAIHMLPEYWSGW